MGYICPHCGEGLPEDTPCPCTMGPDDDAIEVRPLRRRALTREIDDTSSPVRQFFDEQFTTGLKDVQRRFRQAAPSLAVPPAPQAQANPGTVGGAADWLLRFLVCPDPSVDLAVAGAAHLSPGMMMGVAELAMLLGVTGLPGTLSMEARPSPGRPTPSPGQWLARAWMRNCWRAGAGPWRWLLRRSAQPRLPPWARQRSSTAGR